MWRLFTVFFLFCCASFVSAQVEITEVMYDLEGGDSGREWIEIYNAGGDSVDIPAWRFFEADTNHKLKVISGDGILSAGEYAVIVSDDTKFYIDNSTFSGDVFDSSFSLHNTGEELIMKDVELNNIDSVTYSSELGASGDGNSLQKVNGSWCAGVPTLGIENITVCDTGIGDLPDEEEDNTETEVNTNFSNGSVYEPAVEPKITAYAGAREKVALVGARVIFNGAVYTAEGDEIMGARYIWNFGDGSNGRSQKIEHTYYYPGEYIVVLDVASGIYAAMDRVKVIVSPADIVISEIGNEKDFFVEVANNTKYELDISGWKIRAGEEIFVFPKGTYIFPKKSVRIAPNTTQFSFSKKVSLLYQNDAIVHVYQEHQEEKDSMIEAVAIISNEPVVQRGGNFSAKDVVIENEADYGISLASLVMAQVQETESVSIVQEVEQEKFAQLASAYETKKTSSDKKEGGLFWGIVGVALIVLIAIYAVLESKSVSYTPGVKSEADLYKIIEIDPD